MSNSEEVKAVLPIDSVQKLDMDCWSLIVAFARNPLTLLTIASVSKELQRLVHCSLPCVQSQPLAIYSHRALLAPVFNAIGCRLGNQYIVAKNKRVYTTSFTKDEFQSFFESLSERHRVFLMCVLN